KKASRKHPEDRSKELTGRSEPSHPYRALPRPLAQMPNAQPSGARNLLDHNMSLEALLRLHSSTLGPSVVNDPCLTDQIRQQTTTRSVTTGSLATCNFLPSRS